jgi:hypothetical protein
MKKLINIFAGLFILLVAIQTSSAQVLNPSSNSFKSLNPGTAPGIGGIP